jgi:hypothetical protein
VSVGWTCGFFVCSSMRLHFVANFRTQTDFSSAQLEFITAKLESSILVLIRYAIIM